MEEGAGRGVPSPEPRNNTANLIIMNRNGATNNAVASRGSKFRPRLNNAKTVFKCRFREILAKTDPKSEILAKYRPFSGKKKCKMFRIPLHCPFFAIITY